MPERLCVYVYLEGSVHMPRSLSKYVCFKAAV